MDEATVIEIAVQTMIVTAKVAAPILVTTLAVGFFVSLVQSATQIQEFTMTFVPKLLGVAVVIVVAGSWMLTELQSFTRAMFDLVPELLG
jgi:flagellar biosynthetic protein FliQ